MNTGTPFTPSLPTQPFAECSQWLSAHRVWGQLPAEVLQVIAHSFYCFEVEPKTLIYQAGQKPNGLYLLRQGTVEIFHQSPLGRSLIRYRKEGDLFGYTLAPNSVDGVYQASAIALTASRVGFLPQTTFQTLIAQYPTFQQIIYALVAQDLNEYAARIAWEEVRLQGLQSYIQPVPTDAIILGTSKATQKLKAQIDQAATTLKPIVFQAQAGTGKTFLAGLIHARSELAAQPFAELDCAELPCTADGRLNTDALFGRVGQRSGIVELLERGTLLL
ncbi:MAG TPA: cyclic nucleotide-binding domain-containing protein, partial [Allocoleopsis sp.]